MKLLKDNGDCQHCVGDHKTADCRRKDRTCGGRKEDRGCTKSHNLHELFCLQAKVFMGTSATEVVLLIMKVRTVRNGVANVFFDSGCTSNFVREDFAKSCGFKGKQEELSVTTLVGV